MGHPSRERVRVISLVVAGLLVAIGACDAPTAPREPLVIRVTSTPISVATLGGDAYGLRISCAFRLIASATGSGRALRQSAIIRFFAGADRTVPIDTTVLTEQEIRNAWTMSSISPGLPDTSEWNFTAGVPFEVETSFSYLEQGGRTEPHLATARSICGPVPGRTPAPPTASLVRVRTSDAELNIGDTVEVTVASASADGLWRTGIAISGPFDSTQWRTDSLRRTAEHTFKFVVPRRSRLDLPVTLLLLADDIAMARTTSLHALDLRVIDRSPPSVFVNVEPMRAPTGVPIVFRMFGQDNNAVRTLVWELDGDVQLRDSITVVESTTIHEHEIRFTPPADWVGKRARLRARAYDDAGLRSAEFVSREDLLIFHESFSAPTSTFTFVPEGLPSPVAYDPARGRFFGYFGNPGRVLGLDLATMTHVPTVAIAAVSALAASPSGDSLWIATSTSRLLRVHSTATGGSLGSVAITAIDSISPPGTPGTAPDWIAPLVTGKVLVHFAGVPGVVELDVATGQQRHRREFEPSEAGLRGMLAPDRARVLLLASGCRRWYLALSDSLTPCGPWSHLGQGYVSFSSSGASLGFNGLIVDSDFAPLGPADVNGMSIPAADGLHHWNANFSTGRLVKVRTADGTILKSTALPIPPWQQWFLPGGQSVVMLTWYGLQRFDLAGH